IRRMMAPDPEKRYQKAMEVALAVATWGTPHRAAPPAAEPVPEAQPVADEITRRDLAFDTPGPIAVPTPVDLRAVPTERPPAPAPVPAAAPATAARLPERPVVKLTAPAASRVPSWTGRVPLWQWVAAGALAVVVGLVLAFATHSKKPAAGAKDAPPPSAPTR
ncbi:MAG TPA: hypothetical protein VKE74_03830, partial [Gemmataceae bacterium]|nr:hypothetical protein [Gemmataceae bacterium]